MTRHLAKILANCALFCASIALGYLIAVEGTPLTHAEAASPPDTHQQNADIYACCGFPTTFAGTVAGDLSSINPLTQKIRAGRRDLTFSYTVVSGCADGNMRQTLAAAMTSTRQVTGITYTEVSSGQDVSIRATCGVDAVNVGITGSVIADLYPNWPYVNTINATTTMATFYTLSQIAIWEHELIGHAMSTWHEQYQLNGSFGSTPGMVDFMNTGPDSRYDWPQNDKDRWERTMYPLAAAADPCAFGDPNGDGLSWHPCETADGSHGRWYAADNRSYDPATGIWYNVRGGREWGQCNRATPTSPADCWNIRKGIWVFKAAEPYPFDPEFGFLAPPI